MDYEEERKRLLSVCFMLLGIPVLCAFAINRLILGETISARGLVGCGLMLAGMLISQLWGIMVKKSVSSSD